MVPVIEQPRPEPIDVFDALIGERDAADVPGMMADRIGRLWAEEERASRLARTEALIKAAEGLD